MSSSRRLTATHLPPRLAEADKASVSYWLPTLTEQRDRFEASLRSSLSAAIELGKTLIAAKSALPHGEFGRLFSDHEDPAPGAMSFTSRWAQKVMVVAENQAISNPKRASELPTDLEAVYQLATLTAPALEAAIESGKVHPGMTRAEAKAIKNEAAEADPESAPRPKPPRKRDPSEELADLMSSWCHRLHDFLQANPLPRVRTTARLAIANMMKAVEAIE